GGNRRVAGNVDHCSAGALPCGSRKGAEQSFGQPERAQQVHRERLFQLLAFGVGERCQGSRPETRCVVDQHVELAEIAGDLQRERVDILLTANVAHDSARTRFSGYSFDGSRGSGNEGDARSARGELLDERESEARCSAGDGHPKLVEVASGCHRGCSCAQRTLATSSSELEVKHKSCCHPCMEPVLIISEVSRRSGVASSALRFYEERGLI